MPPRYLTDRPPTRPRIKPQAAKGRPKLSTKCRPLEGKTGNFRKEFPVLRKLNVKGGIPSPSPRYNPPMRVEHLPQRFVYSLRRPKAAPMAETKGTLLCYQSNSSASAK